MLTKLIIKNYAIIDFLEIDFSEKLTIITGETGAGKSILLGALSLILGERADANSFFNKDEKCFVEGHFDLQNLPIKEFFINEELDYDHHTIIR